MARCQNLLANLIGQINELGEVLSPVLSPSEEDGCNSFCSEPTPGCLLAGCIRELSERVDAASATLGDIRQRLCL